MPRQGDQPVGAGAAVGGEGEKSDSSHQVALHVLRHGPLPRSALARAMGLSPGSLTRLSKPLIRSGLLVESGQVTDPDSRRPTRPLDVAVDSHRFVGVDLTGTAAWAVLTDLRVGVLAEARAELADTTPATVAATVTGLVRQLRAPADDPVRPTELSGVGVALGGHVDPGGYVVHADFLGWRTPVDLGSLVHERTGAPVVVGNDLGCLTRAEHWFGVGRELDAFAVVTVGAGIGYGLVLGDRVVEDTDTSLQLLGHLPLDRSGPRCPEGHRGCASALLTTTALLAAAHLGTGRALTWTELLTAAAAGEAPARRVVDDGAADLGQLVAVVANTTSVGHVLLAGEGVDLATVGWESLQRSVAAHRDPRARPLQLTVRPHDFHEWARGAAGAAVHDFTTGPRWIRTTSPPTPRKLGAVEGPRPPHHKHARGEPLDGA